MISSIFRKLATYLSFFFKNKPIIPKKNEMILKKINPMIVNIKPKNLNLKKTHKKFNLEVMKLLKKKEIQKFLRENFIQKMFFVHNRLFIYGELKKLRNKEKRGRNFFNIG